MRVFLPSQHLRGYRQPTGLGSDGRSSHVRLQLGAAGSEAAIHSATVALMNNDLRRLPFLITLSRRTRQVIHQNFLVGVVFVLGGMVLGVLKLINPVVAALFHVSGSLLVVFNSFRLVREGEEFEPHPTLSTEMVGSTNAVTSPYL